MAIKVNIDLTKPVGNVGFGIPLIMQENASKAVPYTLVSNTTDVLKAGFVETTDVYKSAQLMLAQKGAPKTIAVCAVESTADIALADVALVSKGWRHLVVVSGSDAVTDVAKVAAVVETLDGKMYFEGLDVDDSTVLNTNGLRRTVLFYCDATEDVPVPVAALVGAIAGKPVGSFTVKNMMLTGVAAQDLTAAQVETIHGKGGLTFIAQAGDSVTSEGKVAGGEYIDVIDSEDYIIQQVTYQVQKMLNKADKIPYSNTGISMLESAVVYVLRDAYNNGMIAENAEGAPDYSVAFALREETTETDRAARKYMGGSFKFTLAGAIHDVEIVGEIAV
jgi:hypothetical protein